MVTLNGQKMGKSLGNAISLHQFFSGDHPLLTRAWKPEVIRFFLLQSHYRSTTDFSEAALEAAETGLNNLHEMVTVVVGATADKDAPLDVEAFRRDFLACMDDDMNTAQAIAVLYEYLKPWRSRILKGEQPSNVAEATEVLREALEVILGIWPRGEAGDHGEVVSGLMELILRLRAGARADKNWPVADQIRDALKALDIVVEDTPEGPNYKLPK
jgi:cysteinyl-tRNA synthetase